MRDPSVPRPLGSEGLPQAQAREGSHLRLGTCRQPEPAGASGLFLPSFSILFLLLLFQTFFPAVSPAYPFHLSLFVFLFFCPPPLSHSLCLSLTSSLFLSPPFTSCFSVESSQISALPRHKNTPQKVFNATQPCALKAINFKMGSFSLVCILSKQSLYFMTF